MSAAPVGTDPKINEQGLLMLLRDEGTPLTPNGVRTALSLMVLGCYDRSVKRRFFSEVLDMAALVGVTIADMESAMRLRAVLLKVDPDRHPEVLDAEIAKLQSKWKWQRRELAEKWALVCECPTSQDSIS
jgi:hypothetical protein